MSRPKNTTAKSAKKTSAAQSTAAPKREARAKQGELIFSLDIGTRTVVGIVGRKTEDKFEILDSAVAAHTKRAMIDGQIEDIAEVAKVVKKVKDELEDHLKIRLTRVAIAAAGRALKTRHVRVDIDIDGKDTITEEMVRSFELEAVSQAQSELDASSDAGDILFYCVGHSVVNYFLDDYPIKNFVGHKGKVASVDMIAAFLPNIVVESLYAVMDKNRLEVASLTLEPIAAMNVLIPPEVRLINIALVDIGAGTSDIAIAKNGSIVAYAMATIAGDEITEEIIRRYLVDFDTAEAMKMNSDAAEIAFRDILGFEHKLPNEEFLKSLFPAVDLLAQTIADNIVAVNGEAPAAIFLVGGGSLIPELPKIVAEKLGVPDTRVAVGGYNFIKNVVIASDSLMGPEYVTPIGIGVTSTKEDGYDFSVIFLNKRKVRVFNTKALTVLDLLTIAGYKSASIIGRSGRNLTFTLNGEPQNFKGELSTPAVITVNDLPANINTPITQGDNVVVIPAKNGISAEVSVSDIIGDASEKSVTLAGASYKFGTFVTANGEKVNSEYKIQNFDNMEYYTLTTLGNLLGMVPFSSDNFFFYKGKCRLNRDYVLCDGDVITVEEKPAAPSQLPPEPSAPVMQAAAPVQPAPTPIEAPPPAPIVVPAPETPAPAPEAAPAAPLTGRIKILLNGRYVHLERHQDGSPNLFLELTALANLDTSRPQGTGNILLTLNGKRVNYTDPIDEGDVAVIAWEV